MPRRGWSQLEVPSGWIQVLRGPRPKSVQWPSQRSAIRQTFRSHVVVGGSLTRRQGSAPIKPRRGHAGRTRKGTTARNSVGRVGRVRFSRGPRIAERVEVCPARIRRVTGRCAGEGVRGIHQQVPEPVGLEKERAKEQDMLDAPQHG